MTSHEKRDVDKRKYRIHTLPGSGRERNVRMWRHSFHVFFGETKRIKLLQNINHGSIEMGGIFVLLSVNACVSLL